MILLLGTFLSSLVGDWRRVSDDGNCCFELNSLCFSVTSHTARTVGGGTLHVVCVCTSSFTCARSWHRQLASPPDRDDALPAAEHVERSARDAQGDIIDDIDDSSSINDNSTNVVKACAVAR
jgi:hypothetical protein